MKRKWTQWLVPAALAALLFWVTSRPPRPGNFVRVPSPSRPMPAWTMTDLEGRAVSSTNFAGKVIVLNFWATFCPPCITELPELKSFHSAQETNGVVVIGASVDDGGAELVRNFAERRKLNFPILLAGQDTRDSFGGTIPLPSTFVVDRRGLIVARYIGTLTEEELTKTVAPLLNATP